MENIKRETNASLERLGRRFVKTKDQETPPRLNMERHDAFVDVVEASVTDTMHEPLR